MRVELTVDLQHDGGLLGVTAGVGGLAAVDAGVLDDGVVNDEPGPGRLGVQRHPPGGHDALALRVVPLQPHRLAKSCGGGGTTTDGSELIPPRHGTGRVSTMTPTNIGFNPICVDI